MRMVNYVFRQFLATIFACSGAFATGTIYGWSSIASQSLVSQGKQAIGVALTPDQWSFAVAIVSIAGATFCIPSGVMTKTLGRRLSLIIFAVPLLLGWVLILTANSPLMIFMARILHGFAAGGYSITVPMYVGEIAEPAIRGKLLSCFQLTLAMGVLFIYLLGFLAPLFWATLVCGVTTLLFITGLFFMPESPTFLVDRGRYKHAEQAVLWLRGDKSKADAELTDLRNQHDKLLSITTNTWEALKRRTTVRGLIMAFGVVFFFQMSGINAVLFFASEIFEATASNISADASSIIIGVAQVLATLASSFLVERLGRRMLLQLSGLFMAISMLVMGSYFFAKDVNPATVDSYNWIPVVALSVFAIAFSIGYGPIPWILLGELFEVDIKSLAVSLGTILSFALSFLVALSFSIIRDNYGIGQAFWLFAVFSILGLVFVHFVLRETKGKSFQEIQDMLAEK